MVLVVLVNIDSVSVEMVQTEMARMVTRVIQVAHPHSNRVAVADPVVHTHGAAVPNGTDFLRHVDDRQVFHSNYYYYSCLFVLPVIHLIQEYNLSRVVGWIGFSFSHIDLLNAQDKLL